MNNINNSSSLLNSVPNMKREILGYLGVEDLKSVRLTCKELHKRVSEVSVWKSYEIRQRVITQIPYLRKIQEKIDQSYKASEKALLIFGSIGSGLTWLGIGKILYTACSHGIWDKTTTLITVGAGFIVVPIIGRQVQLKKDSKECSNLLDQAEKYREDEKDPVLGKSLLQKIEEILFKYR